LQWDEIKTTSYLTSIMEGYRSAPMTDYTLGYVFVNDQQLIDGCHRVTILFYLLQHLHQVAVQHHWDWSRQIAPLITNHEEPYHQFLSGNPTMSHQQVTFPYGATTYTLVSVDTPISSLQSIIAKVIDDHLADSDYPSFAQWLLHHGILTVV
jgi:hypothetical protein